MKNKKSAFSLIEVVLALAVIAIGILPIMSMYPSALKMAVKATTNEEWSRVSGTILDYVKSRGYSGLKDLTWNGTILDKEYGSSSVSGFNKIGTNYTNINFEKDFLGLTSSAIEPNLFFINTKGLRLEDYKFSVYMEQVQPMSAATGGTALYSKYNFANHTIVSSTTASGIIFGIIKVKEKSKAFDSSPGFDETNRDMKFVITPIENWGE